MTEPAGRRVGPPRPGRKRTRSLVDYVRREMEQRIITGELAPGTRLEEAAIARELGVSRTPVREAVRQLAAARLVEQALNRSAVVAKPDRDELASLFETTAELEALCAGFAAGRMRQIDRPELERLCKACETAAQAGDLAGYADANELFHDFIWQAAANASLREVMAMIRTRTAPFRMAQFSDPMRVEASIREHRRIFEAISAGDADAAATAMRDHLAGAGRKVLKFVFPGH